MAVEGPQLPIPLLAPLPPMEGRPHARRTDVLAFLRTTIREKGDFLHFPNKLPLFKELYHILADSHWEVRYECLQLISDLVPICGADLDACMAIVLPRLIGNMGHPKVAVRRSTIQTLHSYMKQTDNVQYVFEAIVSHGLESEEQGPSQECTVLSLPMLLTPEFDKENYTVLVQALARQLVMAEDDKQQAAFFSLHKIKQLVGDERFRKYLQKLPPTVVQQYDRMTRGDNMEALATPTNQEDVSADEEHFEFGIIPVDVMEKLIDEQNWNARCQGAEALRALVASLNDVGPLIPHLGSFLVLLNRLVSDVNFKITTVSLEIYKLLIDRVKYRIRPHLSIVVGALLRHSADSKLVVRSGCVKALLQLMQCVSPMPVIASVVANLQHRSSKLREESINLITAALLTFPSYEFDLVVVSNSVAPVLLDPKRKIRQSVLECLAVLSQALGPSRSSLLMDSLEVLQRKHATDNVVAAVQARLARRLLPRLASDGLVEYSVHIPTSAGKRGQPLGVKGADIDWILAGSGSLSSGSRSAQIDYDRDVSGSTSRSSPLNSFPSSPSTIRRIVSPGRHRMRLPWEDDGANPKTGPQRTRALSDDNIYTSSKQKFVCDDQSSGIVQASNHLNSSLQAGASQKQVYLQKLRHQTDKDGDKDAVNRLGVSILPNKPPSLEEKSKPQGLLRRESHRHASSSSLASTWPLQAPMASGQKKVLDPIHGLAVSRNTKSNKEVFVTEKPVPTRPTIARSSSAHKHRKVPPIGIAPSFTVLQCSPKRWSPFHSGDDACLPSNQQEDQITQGEAGLYASTVGKFASETPAKKERSSPEDNDEDVPFSGKPVLARSPSLTKLKSSNNNNNNSNNSNNNNHQQHNGSRDSVLRPDNFLDEDMNVVGRGMLLRSSASSSVKSAVADPHTPPDLEVVAVEPVRTVKSDPLPLVQGVGVGASSATQVNTLKPSEPDIFSSDYDHLEDSGDEGPYTMSMSKKTSDRILFKKQERLKEAEKRRFYKKPLQLGSDDDDDDSDPDASYPAPVFAFNPGSVRQAPPKPSFMRKAADKSPQPSVQDHSLIVPISNSDSKPFKNPDNALHEALKLINSSEWADKCEGMQMVTRLACHHSEVLVADLHAVIGVLLREVKNLRSSVARAAIVSLSSLFLYLKRHMETDLDNVCKVLLHKSGDTNKFIQEDVEKALTCMVENINPQRAGLALIQGGASHKNAAVRKLTSLLLAEVTDSLGAAKVLSGAKDVTDKFLLTAAEFVRDNTPQTRYYGRLMFHLIIYHPNFETMLQKFVPPTTIRNIKNVLDGIKLKGPGDKPSSAPLGRVRQNLSKTM